MEEDSPLTLFFKEEHGLKTSGGEELMKNQGCVCVVM